MPVPIKQESRFIMANTTTKGTTPRSGKTSLGKKPPKTSTTAAPRKARVKTAAESHEISPDLRQQMIAEAAYLRAERRGFGPGDPLEDWLSAEREVDMLLAERTHPITQ
jgi:hypothetical protein